MTRKVQNSSSSDRITVEALKYYVPLFQIGDKATDRLLDGDYSIEELNLLRSESKLKDLSVRKIATLCGPLITREIDKLIKNSHLKGRDNNLFDILYYAGIGGMEKGLRRFDVNKINKSSTNYLFQWILTYSKKELSVIEAPFGVAPSRFAKYKKISAVRKHLSSDLGRYATNEEVLEYFLTGKADLKTMNGRVKKSGKLYASNQSITLELVTEQEDFEQNLNYVNLLDPLADYTTDIKLSSNDPTLFSETFFGSFLNAYDFTDEAKAVLMSDLNVSHLPDNYEKIIESLGQKEYKSLSARWKDLMKDINGPFYEYLKQSVNKEYEQFDITRTIRAIEEEAKNVSSSRYLPLFIENKVTRK